MADVFFFIIYRLYKLYLMYFGWKLENIELTNILKFHTKSNPISGSNQASWQKYAVNGTIYMDKNVLNINLVNVFSFIFDLQIRR